MTSRSGHVYFPHNNLFQSECHVSQAVNCTPDLQGIVRDVSHVNVTLYFINVIY